MITRTATHLYYNGFMWQIVLTRDGKRVVRPLRLAGGALSARLANGA